MSKKLKKIQKYVSAAAYIKHDGVYYERMAPFARPPICEKALKVCIGSKPARVLQEAGSHVPPEVADKWVHDVLGDDLSGYSSSLIIAVHSSCGPIAGLKTMAINSEHRYPDFVRELCSPKTPTQMMHWLQDWLNRILTRTDVEHVIKDTHYVTDHFLDLMHKAPNMYCALAITECVRAINKVITVKLTDTLNGSDTENSKGPDSNEQARVYYIKPFEQATREENSEEDAKVESEPEPEGAMINVDIVKSKSHNTEVPSIIVEKIPFKMASGVAQVIRSKDMNTAVRSILCEATHLSFALLQDHVPDKLVYNEILLTFGDGYYAPVVKSANMIKTLLDVRNYAGVNTSISTSVHDQMLSIRHNIIDHCNDPIGAQFVEWTSAVMAFLIILNNEDHEEDPEDEESDEDGESENPVEETSESLEDGDVEIDEDEEDGESDECDESENPVEEDDEYEDDMPEEELMKKLRGQLHYLADKIDTEINYLDEKAGTLMLGDDTKSVIMSYKESISRFRVNSLAEITNNLSPRMRKYPGHKIPTVLNKLKNWTDQVAEMEPHPRKPGALAHSLPPADISKYMFEYAKTYNQLYQMMK